MADVGADPSQATADPSRRPACRRIPRFRGVSDNCREVQDGPGDKQDIAARRRAPMRLGREQGVANEVGQQRAKE